MSESHVTRPSLLVRMRDARDQWAWGEFVEIYSPLVYGFARKQGLQDADAVDVTQEVLRSVARSIGRLDYDAERGSFRGWLFTIVRNELHDWFAKQRSAWIGRGDSPNGLQFDAMPDSDNALSEIWEREHEQRLFAWAAERVRLEVQESTWNAFWKTTVENQSGKAVAAELGLSVAAVYLAKSRVMARLKELVNEA
ncbi:MAG: polymerase sigma factor, sigma-70 family [Planctomycetaceae bacterium]|nr:polymerase sigma factor, sigma-70 family [Planctomycetaceae bacterium]